MAIPKPETSPSQAEQAQAQALLDKYQDVSQLLDAALPNAVPPLVQDILEAMAAGKAVTVLPFDTELSTVEAARILKVSRPFLIGLLEEGKIPHRKVGSHRRVLLEDVLNFKQTIDAERYKALEALAKQAQELNMGYE